MPLKKKAIVTLTITILISLLVSLYIEPAAEKENVPLNEIDLIDEAGTEAIKITDEAVVIDSESNWKKDNTMPYLLKFIIIGISILVPIASIVAIYGL